MLIFSVSFQFYRMSPKGQTHPAAWLALNYSFSHFLVDVGFFVGSQLNRELAKVLSWEGKKENGDAGDRTPCLSHAKRALYHLSYIPLITWQHKKDRALVTSRSTHGCISLLPSYGFASYKFSL
ncbi:hypothetical protein V6N11_080748 [Hibiscus sabdariffa]|uniref:Uncharacterized protein n=1 Tax=Hibiscus sabdariffa TaxID=183260 RepID=A0ABR2QHT6_9ROSI